MPQQARNLVQELQEDRLVNMEVGWKLITMFIGGNDLCRICDGTVCVFSSRLPDKSARLKKRAQMRKSTKGSQTSYYDGIFVIFTTIPPLMSYVTLDIY